MQRSDLKVGHCYALDDGRRCRITVIEGERVRFAQWRQGEPGPVMAETGAGEEKAGALLGMISAEIPCPEQARGTPSKAEG